MKLGGDDDKNSGNFKEKFTDSVKCFHNKFNFFNDVMKK
jgi:hypothetical protein